MTVIGCGGFWRRSGDVRGLRAKERGRWVLDRELLERSFAGNVWFRGPLFCSSRCGERTPSSRPHHRLRNSSLQCSSGADELVNQSIRDRPLRNRVGEVDHSLPKTRSSLFQIVLPNAFRSFSNHCRFAFPKRIFPGISCAAFVLRHSFVIRHSSFLKHPDSEHSAHCPQYTGAAARPRRPSGG